MDTISIALAFNECINNADIEGLTALMTGDHVFTDTEDDVVTGRSANRENWIKFFALCPGYRNIFERVEARDDVVIMQGYSVCPSFPTLHNFKALWLAVVEGDKLREWQVLHDTWENRERLGIYTN